MVHGTDFADFEDFGTIKKKHCYINWLLEHFIYIAISVYIDIFKPRIYTTPYIYQNRAKPRIYTLYIPQIFSRLTARKYTINAFFICFRAPVGAPRKF